MPKFLPKLSERTDRLRKLLKKSRRGNGEPNKKKILDNRTLRTSHKSDCTQWMDFFNQKHWQLTKNFVSLERSAFLFEKFFS